MTGRLPVRVIVVVGVMVALLIGGVASFYASGSPDGLERVATDHGFIDQAEQPPAAGSPLADYDTRGVEDARLSGGLAGVVGTLVVLGAGSGLFLLVRRRNREPT